MSEEFIAAHHGLGPSAGKVIFAAVNVSPLPRRRPRRGAVLRRAPADLHPRLALLHRPTPQLEAVWHGYNIEVQPRGPQADTIHTSAVYFIDPQGRERYLATPVAGFTKAGGDYLPVGQIAAWGRGIALVARSLTP